MSHNQSLQETISLVERAEYDQASADATATQILSSDVQEERVLIPLALIVSDTSGAANDFTLNKVDESGNSQQIHGTFNLAASETRVINLMDDGPVLPKLEGGTNIEINPSADGVDATLTWVHNIKD